MREREFVVAISAVGIVILAILVFATVYLLSHIVMVGAFDITGRPRFSGYHDVHLRYKLCRSDIRCFR